MTRPAENLLSLSHTGCMTEVSKSLSGYAFLHLVIGLLGNGPLSRVPIKQRKPISNPPITPSASHFVHLPRIIIRFKEFLVLFLVADKRLISSCLYRWSLPALYLLADSHPSEPCPTLLKSLRLANDPFISTLCLNSFNSQVRSIPSCLGLWSGTCQRPRSVTLWA